MAGPRECCTGVQLSRPNERPIDDSIERTGEPQDALLAAHEGENRFQSELRLKVRPSVVPLFSPLTPGGRGRIRRHTLGVPRNPAPRRQPLFRQDPVAEDVKIENR